MKHQYSKTALQTDYNIYAKLPSNIDEQILILKSRGMTVNDSTHAKKFLAENYFHRFLSYSVHFFESTLNNTSKRYRQDTDFKDVVKVYEFDSKLRLLILEAIEVIEISIKTQFIHLSWRYGAHFYLNHKLFRDHKLLNDSIERIQYQMRVSSDLLINEYFAKYQDPEMPPVWVAMDLISIGQLGKWLQNLKSEEDKKEIAKRYKLHYTVLQAVINNLTHIRNYSAHHARIWNHHYDFAECVIVDHKSMIENVLCSSENKIYGLLILITYILHHIDDARSFVRDLVNYIKIYNIDINAMGFPDAWRQNFNDILDDEK